MQESQIRVQEKSKVINLSPRRSSMIGKEKPSLQMSNAPIICNLIINFLRDSIFLIYFWFKEYKLYSLSNILLWQALITSL